MQLKKVKSKTLNTYVINKATLEGIVAKNHKKLIFDRELLAIELPESKSEIVRSNNYMLYAAKYRGLAGLFSKEKQDTKLFGRAMCDYIKFRFSSHGFFTTDELPRYGITRAETRIIYNHADKKEGDLIILFAYNKNKSQEINGHLCEIIEKLLIDTEDIIDLQTIVTT